MKKKALGFTVGKSYLIRTVTYFQLGKLLSITPAELVLGTASWIADTGRFATALETGVLSEVEPFPGNIIINRLAIVDACEWTHPLPTEQN